MTEVGVALLRVAIGVAVAYLHGWHKVTDGWRYFTAGAEWPLLHDTMQLGAPLPVLFAVVAAASQFAGGGLLACGAATRLSAFMVSATMLGAVAFNVRTAGPDVQLAALYALVTGVFVVIGGGWWSVDGVLGESRS
jgi:putative oxidoreductase